MRADRDEELLNLGPNDFGPKPHLGYTANPLDRAAEKRADTAFLDSLEKAPGSGSYIIGGEMVVLKKSADHLDPLFTAGELQALARVFAPTSERVFLGSLGDTGRFGRAIAQDAIEDLKTRDDFLVSDLRSLAVQGLIGADHLAPLAEAKALLHWHARHHFCANCGQPTRVTDGGWRRDCAHCDAQHFPRTDPVVIMLTIDGEDCLLGRGERFLPGMWSCLAGFVEPGESIEDAVLRETYEEAGVRCGRVRYFASQPWPYPSSLMIGCFAEARSREIVVDRNELEDARWFSRDEVLSMLAGRHPDGLTIPPPLAIAHHLIRAWLEGAWLESAHTSQ